jgi:hypothetical protein
MWPGRLSRGGVAVLAATAVLAGAPGAGAFVATAVGGRPGELDVQGKVTVERGKIEPNENDASWQKATGWYEYTLGAGYTFGHLGPLQFFSARLEATHYQSPAERSDPTKWQVNPEGSSPPGTLGAECAAGATYLGDFTCEFHAEDRGTIVTASISAAVAHDPKYAFGLYLRGQAPLGMDLDKFANPRIDYFSGGWQAGVELTDWLGYESILFVGGGTRPFGKQQNGAVALNNLLHFRARRWLLPWKAGVKIGPYVEGDLHERFDARYDAAFSPTELPQPGQSPKRATDRIRAARFAVALLPYFLVTEHLAVELGYVQKFFGYDARATQAWFGGVRGLVVLAD